MLCKRVDFYLLKNKKYDANIAAINSVICRIIEKAYSCHMQVLIYCPNKERAENLDKLLWVFKDTSFIPHKIFQVNSYSQPPVVLGYESLHPQEGEILFNLTDQVPDFLSHYKRVIELILPDEESKKWGRLRFQYYRNINLVPNTVNL